MRSRDQFPSTAGFDPLTFYRSAEGLGVNFLFMNDLPLPDGVLVRSLKKHEDSRGWLFEMFRQDELPEGLDIAMSYLSFTHPGIGRGPHEHEFQTDYFVFFDGEYELHLWENRPTKDPLHVVLKVGEYNPVSVVVPPGVVHGYRNAGSNGALVFNAPDKLYAGKGRSEPVDEIRHESDPASPFNF